jgi:uncharacterized protein (TIGR03437 family)
MNGYRCLLPALLWTTLTLAGSVPAYRIETVAGSARLGDGGPATLAQIAGVQGIATDRFGNIYLSDTDHHRVRKIDASGTITTLAGTGLPGFSGDGGPAALAQLNFPYGLSVDLAGYLYIADLGNNRVRRVSPDGIIRTYAGGSATSLGDGGPAVSAQLISPRNVIIDSAGGLYISEFEGHRIRKVTPDGRIATIAGNGVAGQRGDGGLATAAQLAFPAGLALDRTGMLYVADSQNHRIRRIIPGGPIATVAADAFLSPVGLAVDASNNIFVAAADAVVRCFTATAVWVNVAGTGKEGFTGDGGPAASAMLAAPRDVALDIAGNLLIGDGMRIRRVDSRGQIQTVAGDGYLRSVGDGEAATGGILYQPSAVSLDANANLYIADTGTQRIRIVQANGIISTFAGTGIAGYDLDQVPAASAELNVPTGVAAAPTGVAWIADSYSHRIRRVARGIISTFAGTGVSGTGSDGLPPLLTQLRGPRAVCTDRTGVLYIVDTSNHRVLRAGPDGLLFTVAGNGAPGDAGDGGSARLAELNQPGGCATDSFGNLYIADTFSHRIRKVSVNGVITTVAGTGQPGSAMDEVAATVSPLNGPRGVAVDGNGNVFLSDTANNRIRQITPDGIIHTIAGTGFAGFSGDGGDAVNARISTPLGLVVDGAGDIYFADSLNHRVRRLLPQAVVAPAPIVTAPAPLALVNAASLTQGAVAPGESVTVFGAGIGPDAGVAGAFDAAGVLGTLLGGSEIRFDGVPAPLFYAQAGQINAQVPYTVAGANSTHVEVFYQQHSMGTLDLAVAPAAPALLPVVVNQDGSFNGAANPAPRGTVVTLYGTGEGLTSGPNIAGKPAAAPYPTPAAPVCLSVAGVSAQLLYAGSAPGFAGLLQVNAVVPGGFVPSGPVPVTLTVGTATSPVLTVWVR